MPQLGSHDAGDDRDGHHADRIGVDFPAAEIAIHDETGGDGGQPEHQAEGGKIEGTKVNVGEHRFFKYRRGADGRRFGPAGAGHAIFWGGALASATGSGAILEPCPPLLLTPAPRFSTPANRSRSGW